MLTLSNRQLSELRNIASSQSAPEALPDISHISIDSSLPVAMRLERFVHDGGNPYLFRVNNTIVHVRYGNGRVTLQERLLRLALK